MELGNINEQIRRFKLEGKFGFADRLESTAKVREIELCKMHQRLNRLSIAEKRLEKGDLT